MVPSTLEPTPRNRIGPVPNRLYVRVVTNAVSSRKACIAPCFEVDETEVTPAGSDAGVGRAACKFVRDDRRAVGGTGDGGVGAV